MTVESTLYEKLTDEEDARACIDISEDACRETPRSFQLILASYALTKLGDSIASPKTTLAWLTTALGAPAWVLGFLVPIRESGSMIPQLFIGSFVRTLPVRKWVWVAGCIGQALAVAGIGVVALYLQGRTAGWAILFLITVFSLARGFCSVAAKDVLGKTIAKPRRGQLAGWSASTAGVISVALGVFLMLSDSARDDTSRLGLLLVGGGGLWLVAALIYAQVPEFPGETSGARNATEALGRLRLLFEDKAFGRFVTARALLMCSALSAPFYVALAQQKPGADIYLLGAFVLAAGLADMLSGPFWGRFADLSSKRVMFFAALLTSGIGLVTLAVDLLLPQVSASSAFLPTAYFVLCLAHSGVRVGRKTYIVNLGSGNLRTDYVAISNTVIGVLLLMVGSVGALAPLITTAGVIGLLALMGLAGALLTTTLPETE